MPISGSVPHVWSVDLGPSRRRIGRGRVSVWKKRLLTQALSLGVRNGDCVDVPFTNLVWVLWTDGRWPQGQETLVLAPQHRLHGRCQTALFVTSTEGRLPPYTGVVRFLDSELAQGGTLHRTGWRFAPFGRRSSSDFESPQD